MKKRCINDIVDATSLYIKAENLDIIKETYMYVLSYIDDPVMIDNMLETAEILTTVYADIETIIASFLYHLLEYEEVKEKDLNNLYERDIVRLTIGVYKLDRIIYSTENDYLIEYYKKIIVGMTEDVRSIIVNLADRVTLMRNISNYSNEEQKKLAKETLEIIAPIAHHLGIYKLKSELEDLSLRTLKPDVYNDILEKLDNIKKDRDDLIEDMIREVKDILDDHHITYEIKGRSKSVYSVFNKLDKGRKFNDIYDLFALRIMVPEESHCYLVLGLLHSKFKPIPKRFKDFIAMPKNNGYMSLHTTVFGAQNELFEIQIRTFEMNEVAENGLAAHWSYKENRNTNKLSTTDQKLEFFKAIIDNHQDKVDKNIYKTIRDNPLHGNIYVFTPKGDVFEMPVGSTPVDFAYKVHTKIGEEMVGAIVNNTIVPLNYILQDNDVVKINTSKNSNGPKLAWLNYAKLNQTKVKIRSYFQKERKEELITFGKTTLDKFIRKKHLPLTEFYKEENIKKILKELKVKELNEVYLGIGNNKYSPKYLYSFIYKEEKIVPNKKTIIPKNNVDISVSGIENIKVNIASCCNPLPYDNIVGFITKNNGITIHRIECYNIKQQDRLIDVNWNKVIKNKYITKIRVLADDNDYLANIINKISSTGIVVKNINIHATDSNMFIYEVMCYLNDNTEFINIKRDLENMNYIGTVERV